MKALIHAFVPITAFFVCQIPATLLARQGGPIIDMHLHADLPPYDLPPETPAGVAAGPFAGPGEIATQLTGVRPNHPGLEPYFARAEECDVPVLIHPAGIGPYLPETIRERIEAIEQAPLLTEEQKRDILYRNAVHFLRRQRHPE